MKSLPDAVIPAGAIDLGALKLSGNDAQPIKTGVYVADSLAISGNARLSVDSASGPVALYVKGEISIAGNGISNSSSVPRNLSIVQVGGAAVSISGNADLTATVYAPQSVLKLSGNGDYYGSFVGVEIAISGNGEFHFDEYLRTASTAPGPLRVMAQWTNPR
jgi:hypothetical protein